MSANLVTIALRPFVPAKGFELSKRFYQALGFTLTFDAVKSPASRVIQASSCSRTITPRIGPRIS